ncbi:hypothetical protein PYCCODRAFT_1224705 [Trametes coccinea BRFM310]|uniref:Uncharacterized protein n=1 Tax=Trametes coccinea (strain BRFM310) TaxID=1353009 RepID=A0A1Y2IXE5_TRAC3|nr:hypothetical protein PYCCODRAFT_1224705 [Trametes coccinea BRFM310]
MLLRAIMPPLICPPVPVRELQITTCSMVARTLGLSAGRFPLGLRELPFLQQPHDPDLSEPPRDLSVGAAWEHVESRALVALNRRGPNGRQHRAC